MTFEKISNFSILSAKIVMFAHWCKVVQWFHSGISCLFFV